MTSQPALDRNASCNPAADDHSCCASRGQVRAGCMEPGQLVGSAPLARPEIGPWRASGEPAYQIRACSIPLAPQMTAAALAPCI